MNKKTPPWCFFIGRRFLIMGRYIRKNITFSENDLLILDEFAKEQHNGNRSLAVSYLIKSVKKLIEEKNNYESFERSLDSLIVQKYRISDTNKKVQIILHLLITLLEKENIELNDLIEYSSNDIYQEAKKLVDKNINRKQYLKNLD
ncbi:MAG: hypothetical protein LBT66_05815 [Methanobrevibacter sp.]|nr:hypothetical protein [Candidatus Methanovirga meridionalis]